MTEVEMIIDSMRHSPVTNGWVINLREKVAERCLPIWVASSQAGVLTTELMGVRPPGPLGDDPISRKIKAVGSKVRSVKIDKFEDNKFSAKLMLDDSDKSSGVDCPFARALAIAVGANVPIFANEAILNKAGITVPA